MIGTTKSNGRFPITEGELALAVLAGITPTARPDQLVLCARCGALVADDQPRERVAYDCCAHHSLVDVDCSRLRPWELNAGSLVESALRALCEDDTP